VEQLEAELESDEELRASLQRAMAEYEVDGDTARAEAYRRQLDGTQRSIAAKRKRLSERTARNAELMSERSAADAAAKAAEKTLQDARASQGYRGERLRIIDPGVAPERPSFPNTPLNVMLAVLAALALSMLYIALEVSYTAQRAESARRSLRVAGR